MKFTFSVLYLCFLKFINSHDSESTEINRIEITPFYDTIIISDVADILGEFQNGNFPFNDILNSESESQENIESLLSEYQNYLDKAHNQRKSYLEKSKLKNKVPLLRHDKYVKTKQTLKGKDNRYFYNNLFRPAIVPFAQTPLNTPPDLSMPQPMNLNKAMSILRKDDSGESFFLKQIMKQNRPGDLFSTIFNPLPEPFKSSCYCKSGQIPCKCNCKQCLIPSHLSNQNHNEPRPISDKKPTEFQLDYPDKVMQNYEYFSSDPYNRSENNVNIGIKIEVQLPKLPNTKFSKFHNREMEFDPEEINSKEYMSTIHLPLPYFNPMEFLGFKKPKHDNIHQITIHKKKKSRFNNNNNNKKHRKKVITFHNPKSTSIAPPSIIEENYTFNNVSQNVSNIHDIMTTNKSIKSGVTVESATVNNTTDATPKNQPTTQVEENVFFMINISNKNDVEKEDAHKIENSIETEFSKVFNITMAVPIVREKREVTDQSTSKSSNNTNVSERNYVTQATVIKTNKDKNETKKFEKNISVDSDLLYWPNVVINKSMNGTKDINTLIMEGEKKNIKLNISTETIRHNRTIAVEQAIFGKVDWNDVDTVLPTFISYVGKYITGVFTICSQNKCHSIKCGQKMCTHRVCEPIDRVNQKGHCGGSNTTDSVASIESVMDLPSNVAFEIVDILKEKMLGTLFGKMTLCISTKCSTFVASKKYYMKSKCITKVLDKTGHCPNVKNANNM